jgi:hypothetical protein
VAPPRPVRIPRESSAPRPASALGTLVERRPNVAGTQRAFRFAVLYVFVLALLDAILVALDLSSAEAGRPGVQDGLQLFLGIAIVLAVGSVLFALSPAPRWVEVRTDGVVVGGRWGQRVLLPPLEKLTPKIARHYPAGFLSSAPVDMVEVYDLRGRRHTYQVQAGLLGPAPSNAAPAR